MGFKMFQSLDFFVLSCFFLTVESQQGPILPPQNVSLQWLNDFRIQLTWAPPPHSMENCEYYVNEGKETTYYVPGQSKEWYILMNGGSQQSLSVETVCNNRHSEPIDVSINYPELVKNFQCYIHAAGQSRCVWEAPDRQATDLRFFYRVCSENAKESVPDECSSYKHNGSLKTGCDLKADLKDTIYIIFNGTVNNTLVRNIFKERLFQKVRPPPLNWTVTKTGNKFHISWTLPDIKPKWTIEVHYTECGIEKTQQYKDTSNTSAEMDLVSHCPYRMRIKATTNNGWTPLSEEKYFDADTNPWLPAVIIIPLTIAGLATLIFVCYRKNKEVILPKVPKPRDLLSDISDNNNKSTVCNLYVPAEEEDNCKITLVADPHINMPDI